MRKYLISILTFVSGSICLILFKLIGSRVSAEGTLVEPFFLVPVGYVFIAIAVVAAIVAALKKPYFNN